MIDELNKLEKLKPSQQAFIKAFLTKQFEFLLYAGPAGTGKSFLIAILACMLANDFPNTKVVVVRKNLTTGRRTIWETYRKVLRLLQIPYKTNDSLLTITLNPGVTDSKGQPMESVLQLIEADRSKDQDWNKLKGVECSFVHIEEANELEQEAYEILKTRKNRWNANGVPDPILMTCNPSIGWVKEMFYDKSTSGVLAAPYLFIQSTKEEMPEKFRKTLETLPPRERDRFLEGLWNYSEDPGQLIKFEWIKNNLAQRSEGGFTHMATDVARYGDDRTVMSYRAGQDLVHYEVFEKHDIAQTAYIMKERLQEHKIGYEHAIVDVVGLGAGVVDILKAQELYVREFGSAESPDEDYKTVFEFKNKRAQYYWKLREGIEKGEIKIIDDKKLIRELTNIRYIIKDKVIAIEAKDEIKKRLGFSPDIADSVMMAYAISDRNVTISTGEGVFRTPHIENNNSGWKGMYGKASKFGF